MGVQRFGPFARADLDDGAPTPLDGFFKQQRHDGLERAGFEMIKQDFGHGSTLSAAGWRHQFATRHAGMREGSFVTVWEIVPNTELPQGAARFIPR
ncbi:MAG: hypothetical protein Devi2KO_37210 [Devosia indica]